MPLRNSWTAGFKCSKCGQFRLAAHLHGHESACWPVHMPIVHTEGGNVNTIAHV